MKRVPFVVLHLAAGAILLWVCQTSPAAIITVPPGLQPGDQYRLTFVTSTVTRADAPDIAYYNAFVTNVAESTPGLAALNTSWTAIASTRDISARDNTQTNPTLEVGVPIYNLAAEQLAPNNAGLWDGSLPAFTSLFVAENNEVLDVLTWTGTAPDGTKLFWLGNGLNMIVGRSGYRNSGWISWGLTVPEQDFHLYAMSGVLTVVPEPSAFLLGGVAVIALVVFGRRRRALKPAG